MFRMLSDRDSNGMASTPMCWIAAAAMILALATLSCSDEAKTPQKAATPTKEAPAAAKTDSEPTKILLWHSYRAMEQKALNEVVTKFNKERTDIEIEMLQIPHQAFADKITAAIPRDNGPDIFIFAHDRIGNWADADIIEPVSAWAKGDLLKSYLEETVKALVYKKSIYGLPLAFKSVVIFYNKDLVPVPPKTDVELIEIAKKNTNKKEKRYGLAYENTSLYFTAPFIHGFGGTILTDDNKIGLSSKGSIDGLNFARDLLHKHAVVPEDVNSNLVTTLFNEGKAAMVLNGPWFRGEIKDTLNWGVAPMPTVVSTGIAMRPYVGSEAVLMSKKSTKKEAAFEVMKYLTGTESGMIRMKVGGQPVAVKAAWDGADVDPALVAFKDQLPESVIMPNGPNMKAVWSPTDQAIYKIVKSGEPAADVIKTTEERIAASLK